MTCLSMRLESLSSAMEQSSLSDILQKSSILTGSINATRSNATDLITLEDVLQTRLAQFRSASGQAEQVLEGKLSPEEIQLETALAALECVEKLQAIIIGSPHDHTNVERQTREEVTIGSKDLAQIRTLLSLVFKWAVESLLSKVIAALPTQAAPKRHQSASIIDLTSVPNDYKVLSSTVDRLFQLLLPSGLQSSLSHSIITSNILGQHLSILLKASIVLGWLPRPLASESIPVQDHLRPLVVHVLALSVVIYYIQLFYSFPVLIYFVNSLLVPEAFSALGLILQDEKLPAYAKKACAYLMSRQLLRKEGVRGLYVAVFGEEEVSGDEAPLEKLERVAELLTTPPHGINPKVRQI